MNGKLFQVFSCRTTGEISSIFSQLSVGGLTWWKSGPFGYEYCSLAIVEAILLANLSQVNFYLSPVTSPAQHEFNIIHCKVKEEEGKSFTVFKKPLKSVLKLSHNSTYLFLLLPWGHLKHRKIVQIKKNCNRENLSLKHSESFYAGLKFTFVTSWSRYIYSIFTTPSKHSIMKKKSYHRTIHCPSLKFS